MLEVHSIDARYEGQRDKDGRNNGQYFHSLIHLITDAREVQIHDSSYGVSLRFNIFIDLNNMFIYVSKIACC